jgi:Arc/MetJ family transcription regulator
LIVESALQNTVTAFQRNAEALFARVAPTTKVRRNAFQNLAEGSALWTSAVGHGYEKHLTDLEMETLTTAFQQRHLLAHTQGVVDDDYIRRTSDARYKSGQRLTIKREAVADTLTLVEQLTRGLGQEAKGNTSSTT